MCRAHQAGTGGFDSGVSGLNNRAVEVPLWLEKLRRAHFLEPWECTWKETVCLEDVENKDSEKSAHPSE